MRLGNALENVVNQCRITVPRSLKRSLCRESLLKMEFLKIATIIGIIILSSTESTTSTSESLSSTTSRILPTKPSTESSTPNDLTTDVSTLYTENIPDNFTVSESVYYNSSNTTTDVSTFYTENIPDNFTVSESVYSNSSNTTTDISTLYNDNIPGNFTVSESVYSNTSNITADIFPTTEPSTASWTQSTQDNAATSITPRELGTVDPQKVSSKEGYTDEKTINENDSTGSTMTKELVTLNTKSIMHTITSNISSASNSTASVMESITPTKNTLSNTSSNTFLEKPTYIVLICLLITLIILFAFIIFKHMKKKESKRYGVKLSSQSTGDQYVCLSNFDRENFDDV